MKKLFGVIVIAVGLSFGYFVVGVSLLHLFMCLMVALSIFGEIVSKRTAIIATFIIIVGHIMFHNGWMKDDLYTTWVFIPFFAFAIYQQWKSGKLVF